MPKNFLLNGLYFGNPLAVISLLGLLRAMEKARPSWKPKASWLNLVPHLHVLADVSEDDICVAAVDHLDYVGSKIKDLADIHRSDYKKIRNIEFMLSDFKKLGDNSDLDLLAALASEGCTEVEKSVERVVPTPLRLVSGAGGQNFLPRLEEATRVDDRSRTCIVKQVNKALFETWKYDEESTIAFRLDPKEDRPQAYRARAPSTDPVFAINGANRLAAIGFTVCYCVPTHKGPSCVLYHDKKLIWPIWTNKLSLSAITTMMSHPDIKGAVQSVNRQKIRSMMRAYSIDRIMAANIVSTGYYKSMTFATRVI